MSFFKSGLRYILCLVAVLLVALLPCGAVPAKNFVVTLDAGHGGKDYGALGAKNNEKTLTLSVVKQLGKLIEKELPYVDVVYTRDKDVYLRLEERASIANKANSDLFISVHVNSVDKRNRNRRNIEGCQVYTLGLHKTAENLAVAKRENAVMELEADHTERYAGFDPNSLESDIVFELSQNKRLDQSIEFAEAVYGQLVDVAGRVPKGVHQAGFYVLWATSMPAVLVELDYICNPRAEQFLASDDGQERMVVALYNAFCAYLNTYGSQVTGRQLPVAQAISCGDGGSRSVVTLASPQPAPAGDAAPAREDAGKTSRKAASQGGIREISDNSGSPKYYVQILASSERLRSGSSELKGMKDVEYYVDGGLFKYAVGTADTLEEAKKLLKKVRKSFPQCFIIKMVNGRRVDYIKP